MHHQEELRAWHISLDPPPTHTHTLSHDVWFFDYEINYCYGHLGRNVLELLPWKALEIFSSDIRKCYWVVWRRTPSVSMEKPTLKSSFSTFLATVPTQLAGGPPKGDLLLCSLVSRRHYSGDSAGMSLQKNSPLKNGCQEIGHYLMGIYRFNSFVYVTVSPP